MTEILELRRTIVLRALEDERIHRSLGPGVVYMIVCYTLSLTTRSFAQISCFFAQDLVTVTNLSFQLAIK